MFQSLRCVHRLITVGSLGSLGTVVPPRVCMVCTSPRDRSNSNSSASDSRYSNSNGGLGMVVPPRVCMECTSPRDGSNSNSSASDGR